MVDVHFIGAGPGDPELITLKGKRLVEEADLVIYTGSLVPEAVVAKIKSGARRLSSAGMTHEEVIVAIEETVAGGGKVARVHTGDPSLYGAIGEQMEALEDLGISYEVVPGVSSFVASAAALKTEFTRTGVSQTVILTRRAGRTPVPELESLAELSKHRASMAIFLSVQAIEEVVEDLLTSYPVDTPVAVVQRASWPDQKIVRGTLSDIAEKVKEAGITRTAQILIGDFLESEGARSLLYDPGFAHGNREEKDHA